MASINQACVTRATAARIISNPMAVMVHQLSGMNALARANTNPSCAIRLIDWLTRSPRIRWTIPKACHRLIAAFVNIITPMPAHWCGAL